jgi:hypothetical protein
MIYWLRSPKPFAGLWATAESLFKGFSAKEGPILSRPFYALEAWVYDNHKEKRIWLRKTKKTISGQPRAGSF